MILRENTQMDPRVANTHRDVCKILTEKKIPFRITGGLLLNEYGVGRPTFDVDVIVARKNWQRAVDVLMVLAIDSEKMGIEGEPEPAAILKSKGGPFIEVFPQGLTAGKIAALRGVQRKHAAGGIGLKLTGDPLVNFINFKLASHLSATNRLQDLSDVQRLAKLKGLPAKFAEKLHPAVRGAFLEVL